MVSEQVALEPILFAFDGGMKLSSSDSEASSNTSLRSLELKEFLSGSDGASRSGPEFERPMAHECKDFSSGSDDSLRSSCSSISNPSNTVSSPEHQYWETQSPMTAEAEEQYEKLLAIGARPALELLAAYDGPELWQHIPRDELGNLTSVGTIMHLKRKTGTWCKPCLFLAMNVCRKAHLCRFCHIRHDEVQVKKIRPSKRAHARNLKLSSSRRNPAQALDPAEELQDEICRYLPNAAESLETSHFCKGIVDEESRQDCLQNSDAALKSSRTSCTRKLQSSTVVSL